MYLLGVTIFASLLHLLFEILAFQSDISFWNNNKSLAGLSTRTLITDLISQTIVFLFLLESDTSLLITIPSLFGIIIQIWKVQICSFVNIGLEVCNGYKSLLFRSEKQLESKLISIDCCLSLVLHDGMKLMILQ